MSTNDRNRRSDQRVQPREPDALQRLGERQEEVRKGARTYRPRPSGNPPPPPPAASPRGHGGNSSRKSGGSVGSSGDGSSSS